MSIYKDAVDLMAKIEHEGGFIETLQYGLRHKDVPAEVAEEWEKAEGLLQELDEVAASIQARLELTVLDAEGEEWEDEWLEDDDELYLAPNNDE